MKYYEVKFRISCDSTITDAVRDVLSAVAGEAGFETFEETDDGLTGYVQQSLFNRPLLDAMLAEMPFGDCTIDYEVSEAEDRDWNEEWEQLGFDPIVIEASTPGTGVSHSSATLIIHDGRHLPSMDTVTSLNPISPVLIEIDAHLAFGTGNHQTTRMVCATLLSMNLSGSRVLDCGTGTGILAIAVLKLGAREAVGYDVDEWSVDNARHNAVINCVDDRFQSLLGDASLLEEGGVGEDFNLVMANINRNILLNDMPRFRSVMAPGASLILSGFYTGDVPRIAECAARLGLIVTGQRAENDWACLLLKG
jgi:ribosomal protein L11 methyltransferase